jgi:hypothetical protein
VVTIPTLPCVENKDPEIVALAKQLKALQEKKAWEEDEQRKREVADKMWWEEMERAKAVEAKWWAEEIAREQGVGQRRSPTLESDVEQGDCIRCQRLSPGCCQDSSIFPQPTTTLLTHMDLPTPPYHLENPPVPF